MSDRERISHLTVEHLGRDADDIDLDLFVRAARLVAVSAPDEPTAIDTIWGNGDFVPQVVAMLNSERRLAGRPEHSYDEYRAEAIEGRELVESWFRGKWL